MVRNDFLTEKNADVIFEKYVIPSLDKNDINKVYIHFEIIKKRIIMETLKSLNVSFKNEGDEETNDGEVISIISFNIEDVKGKCPLFYDSVKNPSIFD